LHITAHAEVLKQRLLTRGRETAEAIDARLQRAIALSCPPQCKLIEIHNNLQLISAGSQLLNQLRQLDGWPF
jgi:ribose 1,5-bisphosphokinase